MISIYIRTKLRSYWRSGRYFFCTRLSCTNIVRLGLLHFNCSLSWRFLFLWSSSLLSHHIVRTYQSKVSHVISHAFFTHTQTHAHLFDLTIRYQMTHFINFYWYIFNLWLLALETIEIYFIFRKHFFLKGVNLQVRKTESSFFSIDSGRDRDDFKTKKRKKPNQSLNWEPPLIVTCMAKREKKKCSRDITVKWLGSDHE